jgi:hypothetical protein
MSAEADYRRREADHVRQTLALVDDLLAKPNRSQYETIALGKLLQDVYSGIERVLRTLLDQRDARPPKGADWHKSLLLDHATDHFVLEASLAQMAHHLPEV